MNRIGNVLIVSVIVMLLVIPLPVQAIPLKTLSPHDTYHLTAMLCAQEGFSPHPIPDVGESLQVGYGRNLTFNGLTKKEALYLMLSALQEAEKQMLIYYPEYLHLDPTRRGVLLDLAYNMGVRGLMSFHKFLAAMSKKEWDVAAVELKRSKWSTQVGDARTRELQALVRTGHWPHLIKSKHMEFVRD